MRMPNHEEHCLHSLKRYGVRGDEIHSWMDEPSSVAGSSHRDFRHNLTSLPVAIQMFQSIYGADIVENIFLDHLKADSEESRKREKRLHIENKWSESDDSYLRQNFYLYSDEELESYFINKSKKEIRVRRELLGLIKPKVILGKGLIFKLKRGQKISGSITVRGANNDIDFGLYYYKSNLNNSYPISPLERIINSKEYTYQIEMDGNYFFIINKLGIFSKKTVHFIYKIDEGTKIDLDLQ